MHEPLLAALRRARSLRDSPRDSEGYAYVQALFDALIQNPGALPSDAILPFEANWRPEILILLSRDPRGAENDLLAMCERDMTQPEWVAVCDLLCEIDSKPFFQEMLHEIRADHGFLIKDGESRPYATFPGPIDIVLGPCRIVPRRFPERLPPITLYQLWASPMAVYSSDVVLLERPVPVYYRWGVARAGGAAESLACSSYESSGGGIRQEFVNWFFGSVRHLSQQQSYDLFNPRTAIEWHGAAQAAAEMEKLLDEQASSLQALIEEAQKRGLVQASGRRLTINVYVSDARGNRTTPLPEVASREIVIP
jgi:hypothetical protein